MRSPLSDKTIFITGSGGVLGTAYVNTLLENDAAVVASDLQVIAQCHEEV